MGPAGFGRTELLAKIALHRLNIGIGDELEHLSLGLALFRRREHRAVEQIASCRHALSPWRQGSENTAPRPDDQPPPEAELRRSSHGRSPAAKRPKTAEYR